MTPPERFRPAECAAKNGPSIRRAKSGHLCPATFSPSDRNARLDCVAGNRPGHRLRFGFAARLTCKAERLAYIQGLPREAGACVAFFDSLTLVLGRWRARTGNSMYQG